MLKDNNELEVALAIVNDNNKMELVIVWRLGLLNTIFGLLLAVLKVDINVTRITEIRNVLTYQSLTVM